MKIQTPNIMRSLQTLIDIQNPKKKKNTNIAWCHRRSKKRNTGHKVNIAMSSGTKTSVSRYTLFCDGGNFSTHALRLVRLS